MKISTAEAKNRLTELIRAVKKASGWSSLAMADQWPSLRRRPVEHRKPRVGGMKDRIRLLPGWDAPVDPDRFLEGEL